MISELDATWRRTFKIWWSFTWRTAAMFLAGVILALAFLSILERRGTLDPLLAGRPPANAYTVLATTVLAALLAIFHMAQYMAIRSIVDRRYGGFRLKVFRTLAEDANPKARTPRRVKASWTLALRIWFALNWRTYLYLAYATLLMAVFGSLSLDLMLSLTPLISLGAMQHLLSGSFDGLEMKLTPFSDEDRGSAPPFDDEQV